MKSNLGPATLGCGDRLQRPAGDAVAVLLQPQLAVAVYGQDELFGKRIDHGDTHAVQAAGYFIRVIIELTPGMQGRHDHLGSRELLLLVQVDWNASTIIDDGDRVIGVDADLDRGAMTANASSTQLSTTSNTM